MDIQLHSQTAYCNSFTRLKYMRIFSLGQEPITACFLEKGALSLVKLLVSKVVMAYWLQSCNV